MTSSTTQQEIDKKTTRYWDKMGRLNHLMGAITAADHKRALDQKWKNREAEESAVRKNVWGWDGGEEPVPGEDEVFNLGDIQETHTHYHGQQQSTLTQTSGIAKTLAAVGLAAAGIGVGTAVPIVAWNMTRPDQNFVDTDTDTDTQYGLRIFRESQE